MGMPPLVRAQAFENEVAAVGALHRAGVTIVAGTDQAVGETSASECVPERIGNRGERL